MEINFTILILHLHQERLTELRHLALSFQQKFEVILEKWQKDRIGSAGEPAPSSAGTKKIGAQQLVGGLGGALATIAEEPGAVKSNYTY